MNRFIHNTKTKFFVLLIVAVAAYLTIFRNGFVIDDRYFILDWPMTRNWSNIGHILAGANPESQPGVYRPIRGVLYMAYYHLWGTYPWWYHLHSMVVHLGTTALVFALLRILLKNLQHAENSAFFAALVFALHPIHTESITYLAASMEMIGVMWFFAAMYCYVKRQRIWVVVWAALAFFSYEMTLTLPFLLLLYEATLGKKQHVRVIPVGLVAAAYMFIRISVLQIGLSRGDYLAYSVYHTQLTMTKMWVTYLWLLIWPMNLSHNHTVLPGFEAFMTPYSDLRVILSQSIWDVPVLVSLAILVALMILAVRVRKTFPLLTFAIGWFFISMLPVAYFFPQGTAIAEKYLYIASFSWAVILGALWSRFSKRKSVFIVGAILLVFYFGRTVMRNQDWQSPKTLWEYEARVHPRSELAYFNLGIVYTETGELEKAVAVYKKALELKPEFWQAETNLKNIQEKIGNLPQ